MNFHILDYMLVSVFILLALLPVNGINSHYIKLEYKRVIKLANLRCCRMPKLPGQIPGHVVGQSM